MTPSEAQAALEDVSRYLLANPHLDIVEARFDKQGQLIMTIKSSVDQSILPTEIAGHSVQYVVDDSVVVVLL